jgi:hypothetical protein
VRERSLPIQFPRVCELAIYRRVDSGRYAPLSWTFLPFDADCERILDRLKSRDSALALTKKSANKLST